MAGDPKSVADFKNGRMNAAKALMGRVMAATQGKGNPVLIQKLLEKRLG